MLCFTEDLGGLKLGASDDIGRSGETNLGDSGCDNEGIIAKATGDEVGNSVNRTDEIAKGSDDDSTIGGTGIGKSVPEDEDILDEGSACLEGEPGKLVPETGFGIGSVIGD